MKKIMENISASLGNIKKFYSNTIVKEHIYIYKEFRRSNNWDFIKEEKEIKTIRFLIHNIKDSDRFFKGNNEKYTKTYLQHFFLFLPDLFPSSRLIGLAIESVFGLFKDSAINFFDI